MPNDGITALPPCYTAGRRTPGSYHPPSLREAADVAQREHQQSRKQTLPRRSDRGRRGQLRGGDRRLRLLGPTTSSRGPTAQSKKAGALAFANCMRSHGVPNFPDPNASGPNVQLLGSSSEINSPAFQSAQTSCTHLLPGGGPSSGPPSAQAHAQLLQISKCMRRHGISSFPDPRPGSPPSNLGGYSAIIGHGGYLLAIPSSIDMSSPAFKRSATACNFGPRGHPAPAA